MISISRKSTRSKSKDISRWGSKSRRKIRGRRFNRSKTFKHEQKDQNKKVK